MAECDEKEESRREEAAQRTLAQVNEKKALAAVQAEREAKGVAQQREAATDSAASLRSRIR